MVNEYTQPLSSDVRPLSQTGRMCTSTADVTTFENEEVH